MILNLLFLLVFFITNNRVVNAKDLQSKCSFETGAYIKKLNNPKYIKAINIKTPNSKAYYKNIFSILSAGTNYKDSQNIPPYLRKKFDAELNVIYTFGNCRYKAKLRQHGDWKDHIILNQGNVKRSLDIKLIEGNILNSVKFKLFLPETRNSKNEILGTAILKHLDFIAPETFEVKVKINNEKYNLMLFQEKSSKELLEKNKRREGPIFEGDESLIWSYKDYKLFELIDMSLARFENKNWFSKGKNYEKIVLSSYNKIQNNYLKDIFNRKNQTISSNIKIVRPLLNPNNKNSNLFLDYQFLMLMMNGDHALAPQNRKYLFNIDSYEFEPIYYDGNLNFNKYIFNDEEFYVFKKDYEYSNKSKLFDKEFKSKIFIYYQDRIKNFTKKDKKEFSKKISIFLDNYFLLMNKIKSINWKKIDNDLENNNYLNYYNEKVQKKELDQLIFDKFSYSSNGFYYGFVGDKKLKLSKEDIKNIISKNLYNGKRYIYIDTLNNNSPEIESYFEKRLNANLKASKGIKLKINSEKKILDIFQNKPNDWIQIKDGLINNWKINFHGIKANKDSGLNVQQRLNEYGQTGCLNIYKTNLKNVMLSAQNGECEDSINIVNSTGNISSIEVKDSFQDGIDLDFSNLDIKEVNVENSGNDCLDVSFGTYNINSTNLYVCKDKGISIGEKSNVNLNNNKIKLSQIGISVKDSSILNLEKVSFSNVDKCILAFNKKQEFMGSKTSYKELICNGIIEKDKNSLIKKY